MNISIEGTAVFTKLEFKSENNAVFDVLSSPKLCSVEEGVTLADGGSCLMSDTPPEA